MLILKVKKKRSLRVPGITEFGQMSSRNCPKSENVIITMSRPWVIQVMPPSEVLPRNLASATNWFVLMFEVLTSLLSNELHSSFTDMSVLTCELSELQGDFDSRNHYPVQCPALRKFDIK